jgi:hypothetical protein
VEGAQAVIFVRSLRQPLLLAIWGACLGAVCAAAAAAVLYLRPAALNLTVALAITAAVDLCIAASIAVRALRFRGCRLAMFRDRLVVRQGRLESSALWDRLEAATLGDAGLSSWPRFELSGTLTIRIRQEPALKFRPADFGMDPVECRDLVVRLRDDPRLRRRLPEFDSALDLKKAPVAAR